MVRKILLSASIKPTYFIMHFSAHQYNITWFSRNHTVQTPTWLQSILALKWVPQIFLSKPRTSRKDYKVSTAQKQHRGAWLMPHCGLTAVWGAKVRLKVALWHLYILQVLCKFLPGHTLDHFCLLQCFCHFKTASASCTSGLKWVTGCSEGWTALCAPTNWMCIMWGLVLLEELASVSQMIPSSAMGT